MTGCKGHEPKNYLGVSVPQIEKELHNLLHNFYPRIVDTVNGGYWTNFENDWTRSQNQDKMLVTQARGLWAAARAAEIMPGEPVYRLAADHGYQFLTQELWDTVNGGFYLNYYTDSAQKTDPSFKLTYGNAFALYALSQYAQINKDPDILSWVKKSFDWLEDNMHDSVNRGYFNIALPKNARTNNIRQAGWGDPLWKDQNTSIHLMEAFTAAYKALPEEIIQNRLAEMLELVRDSMTHEDGYLNLYFTEKWQPVTNRDSSREYIRNNPQYDHISFGHNIETAYLLIDASQALYGTPDSITLRIAKKLFDHTLIHGFDKNYYGLFDKGYQFTSGETVEVIDSTKVWWAQAEAWHACALFADLYPQDSSYKNAFKNMWQYITSEVIDPNHGGWYNSGLDISPGTVTDRKAHAWKGCYHDGRALIQVLEYAGKKNQ
jgi:mannobiose 2-epimerase